MYYSYRVQFLSLTALCSCGFRGSDTRVHMAFTHSHTNLKYKGQRERQRKAKCSHARMLDYQLERSQPWLPPCSSVEHWPQGLELFLEAASIVGPLSITQFDLPEAEASYPLRASDVLSVKLHWLLTAVRGWQSSFWSSCSVAFSGLLWSLFQEFIP